MLIGPSKRPLIIRGHTLLCLQGFRGEGYSPAFVENMKAIHRRLSGDPEATVQVTAGPDLICRACPHLQSDGCHLKGPGFEEPMKRQDREVMARLGLAEGEILPWGEILHRIAAQVEGSDLDAVCGSCPWLPLGYCRQGIDALNVLQDRARSS
ncbi:MAG: DUF1284 domain-containing protein [Candidatus Manganitrophaceae bacterium]|nr:MAG: DUF1284 domain-containing protein [Candidatus Manganitrophaceae bacterium]